jgi:DNA-binding transcriptional ArsR family regulator
VGELAAGLPVSRPAVSQHLRVLEAVGLVTHRRNGTKHIYELDSAGVRILRDWVDGFWSDALARFKTAAEEQSRTGGSS